MPASGDEESVRIHRGGQKMRPVRAILGIKKRQLRQREKPIRPKILAQLGQRLVQNIERRRRIGIKTLL